MDTETTDSSRWKIELHAQVADIGEDWAKDMLNEIKYIDAGMIELYSKQIRFMYDHAIEESEKLKNEHDKLTVWEDYNTKVLNEVKAHLEMPTHPLTKLINKFLENFAKNYDQFVETSTAGSKSELMSRIKS